MAAFSYPHHPVFIDPVNYLQNNSPITKNITQEVNNNNINLSCFSQFFPSDSDHHQTVHGIPLESSCLDYSSTKVALSSDDNDETNSVTKKHSVDSSTVVDNSKLETGEQVTQQVTAASPMDNRKRRVTNRYGSSSNSSHSKDVARGKKQKNSNNNYSSVKDKEEKKQKMKKNEDRKKGQEEPPTGYIHVRARRGQATDSHSLAERVRREKISERMKMLQRLVPGCEKVTGKALMLDEIINYVQSLQNQVEFLSMKLASLNPMFYDFGMDLDAFVVRPEGLSNLASQIPSVPQCSQTQPTTAATFTADNTTVPATNLINVTPNNFPLLDNSASFLLQQGQRPNAFSNENGTLLWDVEDHRQSFLDPSGFTNLCSFN